MKKFFSDKKNTALFISFMMISILFISLFSITYVPTVKEISRGDAGVNKVVYYELTNKLDYHVTYIFESSSEGLLDILVVSGSTYSSALGLSAYPKQTHVIAVGAKAFASVDVEIYAKKVVVSTTASDVLIAKLKIRW